MPLRVVVSAGNENGVDAANSKAKENSRVMFVAPGLRSWFSETGYEVLSTG